MLSLFDTIPEHDGQTEFLYQYHTSALLWYRYDAVLPCDKNLESLGYPLVQNRRILRSLVLTHYQRTDGETRRLSLIAL